MDENEARKIIADADMALFCESGFIKKSEDNIVVQLDGDYTIKELKVFAWLMENIPEILLDEEKYQKWREM